LENLMRRSVKLLTAGILALSVGSFSTGAQASQSCFRLSPFTDYLKLEFGPLTNGHKNVYGNWIAPGSYTLSVSGASELNSGSTTIRRLGIVGTNSTTSFGDNLICGLDGIKGSGWEVNCSGGTGANFQATGTLTLISCSGLSPSLATGRAVGAK
jgi:hypothetical protein